MKQALAGRPTLVKVGRFDPDKNWLQAVDALAELHASGINARMIVRGGRDPYADVVFARAHEEHAAFVLARGYAATSLLTYYGDGATPVLQSEEAARWRFQPPPAPNLFDAPGIAVAYVGADYPDLLRSRFRTVEWLERLPRKLGGVEVAAVDLYRVADPIAPPIARTRTGSSPIGSPSAYITNGRSASITTSRAR